MRRAVVDALSNIKTPESYKAIKQMVENGDAIYYVEATAAKALGGMANLKDKEDEVL